MGCDGDRVVACADSLHVTRSQDCRLLGLTCTAAGGVASCGPASTTCAAQSCDGKYLLVEMGNGRTFVDCTSIGYNTCSTVSGKAGCAN